MIAFCITIVVLSCIFLITGDYVIDRTLVGKIHRLKNRNRKLRKKYKEARDMFERSGLCRRIAFMLYEKEIDSLKREVDVLKHQRDFYKSLLEYERDTTTGLWCIDRDPKEVSKEWIEKNAFRLYKTDSDHPEIPNF